MFFFNLLDIDYLVQSRDQNIGTIGSVPEYLGGTRFSMLREREIVISDQFPSQTHPLKAAFSYSDIEGEYDDDTGRIYIDPSLTNYSADYYIVLRHEYGHALMEDLMNSQSKTGLAGLSKSFQSIILSSLKQDTPRGIHNLI